MSILLHKEAAYYVIFMAYWDAENHWLRIQDRAVYEKNILQNITCLNSFGDKLTALPVKMKKGKKNYKLYKYIFLKKVCFALFVRIPKISNLKKIFLYIFFII